MEWPLLRVPFANIVVEEGEGENGEDDVGFAEAHRVEEARAADGLPHEVDTVQQSSQQCGDNSVVMPSSNEHCMHTLRNATPRWHTSLESPVSDTDCRSRSGSCSDNRGQVVHALRLALTDAAAVSTMGSNTYSSDSVGKSPACVSRTLRLGSTAGPSHAITETLAQPSAPRVLSTTSSSRRRTPKANTVAEKTVRGTASSRRTAAAATVVTRTAAARQSRRGGGHTDESPSKSNDTRPMGHSAVSDSKASQPGALRPLASSPLPASPEERAAEAHRLAVQATRPASISLCFDWWMYLCYYDTHALFTSQSGVFEVPLRPLATATAGMFYAELTRCFAVWRRQHWDSLVVLRGAEPLGAGARRRGTSSAKHTVRNPDLLEYANAVWYEGLRVQRLMSQLLLSDSSGDWSFEVGCRDAVLTALGAPPSAEWPPCATSPESATVTPPYSVTPVSLSEVAGTAADESTALVTVTRRATSQVMRTAGGLLIRVPSAARTLSLLRVLDILWNTLPAAIAFRMPVSEMEAPGYYRSIRDPVSLCQLYEEVFCGMTAPTYRSCVHQRAHITRQALDLLERSVSHDGSESALGEEVHSRFFNRTHLRERLTTLKSNCDSYNGAGSDLSQQASALLGAGLKALREAQAEDDRLTAYPVRENAHARKAAFTGPDESVTPQPYAAGASLLEELSSEWFPPSTAAAVVHPSLRRSPSIVEPTAGDNGAAEPSQYGRHKRVLRLLAGSPNHVAATATTTTTTAQTMDFWMQCDDCDTWHKLATRLHPVPDTWSCSCLGLACTPLKKRHKAARGTVKKATREKPMGTKVCTKRRCGVGSAKRMNGTTAASSAVAAAPHSISPQHKDGDGSDDDSNVPLAQMYPVLTGAATVDAPEKPQKRERSTSRKLRTTRERPEKARVGLSTPLSSSSTSSSSSSEGSSSSSSTSTAASRSISRSAHDHDLAPHSDAILRDGDKGRGTPEKHDRLASPLVNRSAVAAHKLSRGVAATRAVQNAAVAAAVTRVSGAGASSRSGKILQQLVQAVTELEGRRLQDNPFDQLKEIRRIEKALNAMD
ncbi:hypothetical protein JKF63_06682 [Porcisia hertigi]|uniref:CW-type domain-containing protein n=1 Tax=Porcisia hertigi TaxID=2761500 RepID=A0A836IN75_9TRYP|nr:hypothetical protein JKF63_06682 [Porcisia hertigi]